MSIHYTLTYANTTNHSVCQANAGSSITFDIYNHGKVQYNDGTANRHVDLLTLYFTPTTAPNPVETFTLYLTQSAAPPAGGKWEVETVDATLFGTSQTATLSVDSDPSGGFAYVLTVCAPTQADEVVDFLLDADGQTPANKLKIRVKRQSSFNCTSGEFDDVYLAPRDWLP